MPVFGIRVMRLRRGMVMQDRVRVVETLAGLRPAFDKQFGLITAGSSSFAGR